MVGTILIGGKYKKKVTGGKTHVQAAKQEWTITSKEGYFQDKNLVRNREVEVA
ncbi:LOW QUALITY PROTEIN: hypothetical protein YC2023_029084 [Brassica napus]